MCSVTIVKVYVQIRVIYLSTFNFNIPVDSKIFALGRDGSLCDKIDLLVKMSI